VAAIGWMIETGCEARGQYLHARSTSPFRARRWRASGGDAARPREVIFDRAAALRDEYSSGSTRCSLIRDVLDGSPAGGMTRFVAGKRDRAASSADLATRGVIVLRRRFGMPAHFSIGFGAKEARVLLRESTFDVLCDYRAGSVSSPIRWTTRSGRRCNRVVCNSLVVRTFDMTIPAFRGGGWNTPVARCRVGAHADARCLSAKWRREESRRCTQECVRPR